MLLDFDKELTGYKERRKMIPNYILINSEDEELLLEEMRKNKLIQSDKPVGKLQYQGTRIIKSSDIPRKYFEVLGN